MANGATTSSSSSNTILNASGQLISGSSGTVPTGESKLPNPLHDYASYNYLFSLTCLTDDELKSCSYRYGLDGPFLARSASIDPEDRVVTAQGKFEFFIENVTIKHLTGFDQTTGNTNAVGFTFKILEPYSMGLFFQAAQVLAKQKGHKNYLDAPYLLALEFTGHKDPDNQMIPLSEHRKYFPIKFRIADMKVTKKGCEYDISAYPVNEQNFENSKHQLSTALSIRGQTVKDMLRDDPEKSLHVYLNSRFKEQKNDKLVNEADTYEIQFPYDPEIGDSSMGFNMYRDGNTPFAKDNLTYENGVFKRGNVSIDPTEAEFKFGTGSDITNVINQVILMSDYGRSALKKPTPDGFVKWWRVETETEYITSDANLNKTGVKPKKYIFRVVPYFVDSSFFLPPNEKRAGTEMDKKDVLKEYNYLYTGNNIDVLDFNISFQTGFYGAILADGNKNEADKILTPQGSSAYSPKEKTFYRKRIQQNNGELDINDREAPSYTMIALKTTRNSASGGGGYDDEESLAARQFHEAISLGTDMVTLDLVILGDPYYLSDSGMGSYHAGIKSKYLNSDGAMPWDRREIHILVNFRTPVDINLQTGMYDFGNTYAVGIFSGLYKVNMGESNFNKGKFTQTLSLMRLRNQDSPTGTGRMNIAPNDTFIEGLGGPAFDDVNAF